MILAMCRRTRVSSVTREGRGRLGATCRRLGFVQSAGFRRSPRSPGTPCKSMGAIVVLLNITSLGYLMEKSFRFGFLNPTFPKRSPHRSTLILNGNPEEYDPVSAAITWRNGSTQPQSRARMFCLTNKQAWCFVFARSISMTVNHIQIGGKNAM
jgi:hypothetical protein